MQKIVVSGGAGFIGSSLVRFICDQTTCSCLNIDCLSYASDVRTLNSAIDNPRYQHLLADIRDRRTIARNLENFKPNLIINLAASTHVDRSIDDPDEFISANVVGTYEFLQAATTYWEKLSPSKRNQFRFLHISTDEVFGSLGTSGHFNETTRYDPRSPYSASKACSDHLVRTWYHTYGLPTLVTNCSNNYGPFQFPEKLIPLVILNALERKPISVYGAGDHVRDWIYVEDHVQALWKVATHAAPGSSYNIGGNSESTNLQVVSEICNVLDELKPHKDGSYSNLIEFVSDRPGHDKRYSIDSSKIHRDLGWQPTVDFKNGLRRTINWYIENEWWWQPIRTRIYAGERLGRGKLT